jgi:hypothetical protein
VDQVDEVDGVDDVDRVGEMDIMLDGKAHVKTEIKGEKLCR